MLSELTATALILSDDARDPDALQPMLAASGYAAIVAGMDGTVDQLLRETRATLVLAHIDLKRDTLAQPSDVAILGLLQREPSFGQEHTVVVLSRTPDVVANVLGPVLARLSIPVLALPFELDSAREVVELAFVRQHQPEPIATIH